LFFFFFSSFYLISSFIAISNLIHELMDPDWALSMTVDIQSKQFANVFSLGPLTKQLDP
jgi:hypothetical protein